MLICMVHSPETTFSALKALLVALMLASCSQPEPPALSPPPPDPIASLASYWQAPLPRVESQSASSTSSIHTTRDAWLDRILPQALPFRGKPLPPATPAAKRLEALRAGEDHTRGYWVEPLDGVPEAKQVIWLIPQYHRSSAYPEVWSSLGAEIAEVQANIARLILTLQQHHGLSHVGLEGQSAGTIPRSRILDRAARWVETLAHRLHAVQQISAAQDARLMPSLTEALRLLEPFLNRYILLLDGVGLALHHLPPDAVHRFGLEDQDLNERAVVLLEKIRELERARIYPAIDPDQPDSDGELALRALWQDEFPAFNTHTRVPLDALVDELGAITTELKRDGLDRDATILSATIRQLKLLIQSVLRPDEVASYYDHYQSRTSGLSSTLSQPSPLSPEQISHNETIDSALAPLQGTYQDIAHRQREEYAVARVTRILQDPQTHSCAVVMGAGHLHSLKARLLKSLPPNTALITIRPFAHSL